MDFAVKDVAGVGPADPTLLRTRGADPLIEIPAAHFLRTIAGLPFLPIPGSVSSTPGALPFSWVESILGPLLAVDKTAAGGAYGEPLLGSLILPSKLESALTQALLEPPDVRLDPNTRYTSLSAAVAAVHEFTDRLDSSSLHPAYLLSAPDLYDVEPPLSGAPAAYRLLHAAGTALTYGSVAGANGFLAHLGLIGFVMFGRAVATSRDTPHSPTRAALLQIEALASSASLLRAGSSLTGVTFKQWLDRTALPNGLALLMEEDGGGPDRREQCLRDRHFLRYGEAGQQEFILANLVLLDPLRSRLPNISTILGRGCSPVDAQTALLRMVQGITNSAISNVSSVATLENLEPALKNLVPTLTMPSLVGATLSQRVAAVIKAVSNNPLATAGGAAGSHSASQLQGSTSIDKAKADIFADELAGAMGRPEWRTVETQLSAELLQPYPSALKLHDVIVNSPVLGARRLALGSKDAALSAVLKSSKPLAHAMHELEDFRAVASLMLVCDLPSMTTTDPNLISFRLPEKTATALKRGAFDEIDWVKDILIEVMRARDPNVATDSFVEGLFDPRVAPQLEPLMQRVSRLLGLPLKPLAPSVPAHPGAEGVPGTAVFLGAAPAATFASLSHIVTTVASENLDITGHPSPFNDDYLTKLRLFETTAWREAAGEFRQRVVSAKNPAGPILGSVLPQSSAARGILATMRATKQRNRSDANTNPTAYALLADYRAGVLGGRHSQRSPAHERSRSRSPPERKATSQDEVGRMTAVTPGSRVDSTLGFAGDGSAFWYTSPETKQRVSPVYDFHTLERIAGKSKDQLDFPVLLSTMPAHKRMSLCAHSHLHNHRAIGSAAHQLPFSDFLDQVRQHFHEPATTRASVAGKCRSSTRTDDRWRQRELTRGKSPTPLDARRSHHHRGPEGLPRRDGEHGTPAAHDAARSRSPSPAHGRRRSPSPSRSPRRAAPKSPGDNNQTTADETNDGGGNQAPAGASYRRSRSESPDRSAGPSAERQNSPQHRRPGASSTQRAKWMAGLILPGRASGASPTTSRGTPTDAWGSTPPLLHLTNPAHAIVRTILLVVALAHDSPMQFLVPPDPNDVIGVAAPQAAPRAAAIAAAKLLAASLRLPGVDPSIQCIPIAERIPALGDKPYAVDRLVALPLGPTLACAAARAVDAGHLPGWRWLTLGALGGLAVYAMAALASSRIRSYFPSSSTRAAQLLMQQSSARWRVGAREHRAAALAPARRRPPQGKRTLADATSRSWSHVRAQVTAADLVLRRMLLAIPSSDPDAEGLHAFADLLKPLNEEEVPPAFKLPDGLPTFERSDLYWTPYSVRVVAPRTAWLPRAAPQPPPPDAFRPSSIRDLLEPAWFDRLSRWYNDLGSWLLDLADAVHKGADDAVEAALAARPKVLVVPASGFVAAARGVIWDLRSGTPTPADFGLPLDTHINLDLVRHWMTTYTDYPDREIFSHLLEGVRFKTKPATQLVLQPHLSSLARGFVSVHRELLRLTQKGFFESYAHPPYAPWVTLPMGVAFRKLEPDRPRRTTDGGAPRKGLGLSQFLVDADGVRVLPLNLLSRHAESDISSGTASVFADAWNERLCRSGFPLPHAVQSAHTPLLRRAAHASTCAGVLLLFSGPCAEPDTLTQQLVQRGLAVLAADIRYGSLRDDLMQPDAVRRHVRDIEAGVYSFVFVAPPCSSYSVAVDDSRPQLRSRAHPRGLPSCPSKWSAYIARHNALADASLACIRAADAAGTPWAVENPTARWDSSEPTAHWRRFQDWGTLWDVFASSGVAPARLLPDDSPHAISGVLEATFAACAFGAPHQKYTTLWCSREASALASRLRGRSCAHTPGRHPEVLQGRRADNGEGRAAAAAAYAPALARELADGIHDAIRSAAAAASLARRVRCASPARPTVQPRPAPPADRGASLFIDVDITREGSTPLLANPFKLGPAGKDERLRQLAFVTYRDWVESRTIRADAVTSALPVAASMRDLTGDRVLAEVHRIVQRYGRHGAFNLVCGRRCHGKLCHGVLLADLFQQVADSAGDLPFPKELKPTVAEIMSDLSVLLHLSHLTGIPVYQVVSDVKDFFNQHHLAPEEKHKVGLVTLDPRAIVEHAERLRRAEPALANIAENVLGYGLACASNICQRTAHLLVFIWLVEMEKAAAPIVRALRLRYPILASWLDHRAEYLEARAPAAATTTYSMVRYAQARLWVASMYTDDGHQALLGPELAIVGLRTWRAIMGELRLTMAIIQKHGIGQQVTVQGCRFNTGLGIVFVPEDKLRRAVRELDVAIHGDICLREYHSLVSFLQSLTFVVGMSRSASYGLFRPLTSHAQDPDALLPLSDSIKAQLVAWRSRLLSCAGAPLHAALDSASPAPPTALNVSPATFYIRSDASKDGAALPGLGGALGALLWRYPNDSALTAAELNLPIAVLEFAAYYGAVEVFADLISADAFVVSEVDALASADSIAAEAARSALMQRVHERLLLLPAFRKLDGRHAVGHIFGEANVLADAASRGNFDVARELAAQLGMVLQWRPHGPLLPLLMAELVALHSAAQPPCTALAQTALGSHNNNMTGSPFAHLPAAVLDTGDLEPAAFAYTPTAPLWGTAWWHCPPLPAEAPPVAVPPPLPSHHILSAPVSVHFADPPQVPQALLPAADMTAADTVAALLAGDASSLALRPTSFALHELCRQLYNPSSAQPVRTSKGQNSAWKHWTAWCAVHNTAPWRLTRHASDTDFHREAVLQAGFIRFCHHRQSATPRNGRKAALVSSALKTLCHIRKMHRDRNFPMCPSPLVTAQVRRLLFEYKAAHGVADMIPKRKEPFTRDILVDVLLATPCGYPTNLGPLSWSSRFGRSLRGLVATLAQAGFRKGEVSVSRAGAPCDANCMSRADLAWLLNGRAYATGEAPVTRLAALQPGDFAVLTPCASKSDPFDMVWGGDPIWLPFQPNEPLCACAALAAIELADALPLAADRRLVALFTTDEGLPFSDAQLDRLLVCLLARSLPPASVKLYSWHSARIFLATTLLAAGASHPEIQALCRWQTTDSIKIYARLTAPTYASLLGGAMAARVSTARAQNLALAVPFIDLQDIRRAAATSPQPPPLQPDDIDLNVHPDDDADDDALDACRDPPACARDAAAAAAFPRAPPLPCSPPGNTALTPLTRPAAMPRAPRARPPTPRARRPLAAPLLRQVALPLTSVAHLSFRFPTSLAGYATYGARPSLRRPPAPRSVSAKPCPARGRVSALTVNSSRRASRS